jgi:hypothetical protein
MYPTTSLALKTIVEKRVDKSEWHRMHTKFPGGRPARIAGDPYQPVGDWLINQIERMRGRLVKLDPKT